MQMMCACCLFCGPVDSGVRVSAVILLPPFGKGCRKNELDLFRTEGVVDSVRSSDAILRWEKMASDLAYAELPCDIVEKLERFLLLPR